MVYTNIGLRIAYPFFVILWLALSVMLNEQAQRRSYHYSTRVAWDNLIPFAPAFALPYFSAYILGNLGYLLLYTHENLYKVVFGYFLLFVVGSLCFTLVPCRVDRQEELAVTNLATRLLVAFQQKSKPFNSFPSMHTSYCLFSALAVTRYGSMGLGSALLIWAGVVALSTLLAKQHHLLDVVAGALLAIIAFWVIR